MIEERGRFRSFLTILAWLGFIAGLTALLVILISDLVNPWITWNAQAYIQLYGIAAAASISLLYLRAESYYRRGLGAASLIYAFFDVLLMLGAFGAIHFGILLPILDPARMTRIGGVKVGFNEIFFACMIMLVTRPALQILLRSQEKRRQIEIAETRRMIMLLESISKRIEQISAPLHERGEEELKRHLDILLKRVEELRESMMSKTAVYARPVAVQPPKILEPEKREEAHVEVVKAATTDTKTQVKPSLPDAAIDNPWMEVLRSRRRGKEGRNS